MRSSHVSFAVNGEEREALVRPGSRLSNVLRESFSLFGVREGCGQGGCGSCTILLDGRAVLSCLIPAETADGAAILTIEGIGRPGALHPLQEAFVRNFATQCGFCTPGMIMSALALLSENPEPSSDEVMVAVSGNVCRCTGYQPIVEAILEAAAMMRDQERAGA
jgi:aerobic carbon-monoxide dehydrogenase small subunit